LGLALHRDSRRAMSEYNDRDGKPNGDGDGERDNLLERGQSSPPSYGSTPAETMGETVSAEESPPPRRFSLSFL
jgi:hypothetical protein